jgi:hypothetical protein
MRSGQGKDSSWLLAANFEFWVVNTPIMADQVRAIWTLQVLLVLSRRWRAPVTRVGLENAICSSHDTEGTRFQY